MKNRIVNHKPSQLTIKSSSQKYETLSKGIPNSEIDSMYLASDRLYIPGSNPQISYETTTTTTTTTSTTTSTTTALPYPLSVCSQIKIQGSTKNAYGTLTFTSLDGNGYPQYSGMVGNGDIYDFPATLTYGTYSSYTTYWAFSTPTQFDTIIGGPTTSLDPTVVTYSGYSLLSGPCV